MNRKLLKWYISHNIRQKNVDKNTQNILHIQISHNSSKTHGENKLSYKVRGRQVSTVTKIKSCTL